MKDKILSDKIRIGGLCCAMIVVLRHAINLKAFFGVENIDNWVAVVELLISKMTEMAVPYFFIVSGFFFFRQSYYSIESYKKMVLKKSRTLFVPYIIWIIIGHFIMVPVGLGELPITFGGVILAFWDAQCAGVLWYVRSLLLMMLLYPVYGWIFIADRKWLYCAFICVAIFLWIPVDMRPLSTEGILFFLLGGVCQKYSLLNKVKNTSGWILILLTVLWVMLTFYSQSFNLWTNRICTVVGILTVWLALDKINRPSSRVLLRYSGMAFFLYVAHIYMLKLLKYTVAQLFYSNEIVAFTSFWVLPITTVVITIMLGELMKKYIPEVFGIICGGRN